MAIVEQPKKLSSAPAGGWPVITMSIIAVNVAVYAAMGLTGVSWTAPGIQDAIRWGGDFGVLTLAGQWWRLVTSVFVHFGIVHILFNMWCLFNLGLSLEPMMGRGAYALLYFASGIAASAVSLSWNQWRVSAGASGAIFGVAGALVAYLALKKVPLQPEIIRRQLKSLAFFILYNLFYGAIHYGTDNSAHLGGLVAGLILGAVIPAAPAMASNAPREPTPAPLGESSSGAATGSLLALIGVGSAAVIFGGVFQIARTHAPEAHYGAAVLHVQRGNMQAAVPELQQAATLAPDLIYAHALLGELKLEQGDPAGAIEPFQRTLELSHKSNLVRHNLALAYLGAGKPADAMRQIAQVMESETDTQWAAEFIFGLAAEQMGNTLAARKYLQLTVQKNPEFREAQDALARLDWIAGQFDAARAKYESVLRHDANDAIANSDMKVLRAAGKAAPALSDLAPFPIPYSKLALKSAGWPYYP